ncbi:MAG: PD-(D/E)XK nuclease family protein [Burkholderiaceae bacterium]|nr:PD-(D/E)XK nuclease family protein [Burkholderiaceae bacterium]
MSDAAPASPSSPASGIHRLALPGTLTPAALWPWLAGQVWAWLAQQGAALRDTVLVLPFLELLPPARQAFAEAGTAGAAAWQPRIETLRTLAASLGPWPGTAQAEDGQPCGDAPLDRLVAAELLRRQAGLGGWQRRDPLAFDAAVAEVVEAATALLRGAAARPPGEREAWWQQAREALGAAQAGSAMAGLLARVALEWAALAAPPASDRLWRLRPAAWVLLSAGEEDPLATALLQAAAQQGVPALHLLADAQTAATALFDLELPAAAHNPRAQVCDDAEAEALAAAGAVIQAVARGRTPVALVAEDRLLVRRIRALLDRRGLAISDESGWTLDTTRAGAALMSLLRAAHASAGRDAWLDWLKNDSLERDQSWIAALERRWRRGGSADAGADAEGPDWIEQRWQERRATLQALAQEPRRPLAGWLALLREWLLAGPRAGRWSGDEDGRAVWQALRLEAASARADVDGLSLSLDDFTRWADALLGEASVRPSAGAAAPPQVVITPLARAMLRPFGAVVLPGADERRLGPPQPGPGLLGEAVLRRLGLPDAQARGERQARCFVQLLRHPELLLLRRHADGDEPLAPSPWWSRLVLARRRRGLPPMPAPDDGAPPPLRLQPTPVLPPRALAVGALPPALSASALAALRACPYRFHARHVLRLAEPQELEADPGKRDWGTLLHRALQLWQDERRDGGAAADEAQAQARLVALAEAAAAEAGVDAAALLPFRAGLDGFASRYLAWQREREAAGWRYRAGEVEHDAPHPALQELKPAAPRLRGRIDRIDARHGGDGLQVQLLDYKTGPLPSLKIQARAGVEDTQLAFYAAQALGGAVPDLDAAAVTGWSAAYVALDDREAIVGVPHEDVLDSARQLLDDLARDWPRLAAGEPLRALGEGETCAWCEVRGLCRRDHWAQAEVPGAPEGGA